MLGHHGLLLLELVDGHINPALAEFVDRQAIDDRNLVAVTSHGERRN